MSKASRGRAEADEENAKQIKYKSNECLLYMSIYVIVFMTYAGLQCAKWKQHLRHRSFNKIGGVVSKETVCAASVGK